MNNTIEKIYYSIEDVVFMFSFSATTWHKLVREKKAPQATIKRYKFVVWHRDDIMRFAKEFQEGKIVF